MSDSGYDNTNRGALFKNDRKEKETQPDYNGSLNVGGVDYWVSSWISKSKAGATYMSLAVTAKESNSDSTKPEKTEQQKLREKMANSATVAETADFNDEIPF